MIIWATSFVWSKIALEYYSSFTIVFFRLILSAIFIFLFIVITRKIKMPKLKHLPIFLLITLFEPFLYFIGETTGLNYVSPAVAAILIAIIPLFTPFAALLFLKERISVLNLIGITISLVGIFFVIFEKDLKLLIAWQGLVLLFLAVISAVLYSIIAKKIPEEYTVFDILLYQNIIGTLYFLPIVAIFFRENIIQTGFVMEPTLAILKLGFFASTIAFLFFLYALRNLPVTNVNVFTNVIPIFTLLFSWIILGDILRQHQIIGIFIVIIGVIISQLRLKSYRRKIDS